MAGRYFFLCAVANHLRYPNSHTFTFSSIILKLFVDAAAPVVQEQITRVLLERLIVNRPHPHGLLVCFVELIRGGYGFWEVSKGVRGVREVEKLFEGVSRSIGMGGGQ
jgi:CCR4-NOT transcription complex subunit 1